MAEYRVQYGAALFDGLYRFACVRNPWDRVLSHYFSPHRGEVEWSPEDFLAFVLRVQPMRHYMVLLGDDPPTLVTAAAHVHHVLRFERLLEDFDAVCATLGLPRRMLAQRNRSAPAVGRDWRDHSDARSRALVEERFGEEAKPFGYRF